MHADAGILPNNPSIHLPYLPYLIYRIYALHSLLSRAGENNEVGRKGGRERRRKEEGKRQPGNPRFYECMMYVFYAATSDQRPHGHHNK